MRQVALMALALTLMCALGSAQDAGVVLSADFEDEDAGAAPFVTMDAEAVLSVTNVEGEVYGGKGSLELTYTQRAAEPDETPEAAMPGSLLLPMEEPPGELEALSFALWSELSTPLAAVLTEGDDGPRYMRLLWCEAAAWHEFAFSLEDFAFDADGPVDPDGKLTPEAISGFAIFDITAFFRREMEDSGLIYIAPPEEQVMRLDDFKLLSSAPDSPAPVPGLVLIADYEPALSGFAVMGGQDMVISDDEGDGDGRAVKIEGMIPARTVLGVIHQVKPGALAGVAELRFRVKSSGLATLIVSIEEKRGKGEDNKASYNKMVDVEPGEPWATVSIPFSEFTLSDDDFDPNGKLDLELVAMIAILDASAMVDQVDIENTLWLDELVAVK